MLSVIVPVYNAENVLPKTIPAMLGQEKTAQWIFVNDGSTDETLAVLESLIATTPCAKGTTVNVLSHADNKGRAAARNTGVEAADGKILAFMDADVAPSRGYLNTLVSVLDRSDTIACVARLQMAEADPTQPYHRYLRSTRRGPQMSDQSKPLHWKHFLLGVCAVNARVVRETGAFSESLSYGEDIEFGCRLSHLYPDGLRYASEATARLYNIGDLSTALSKMREFGRDNLPSMVAEYPELAEWTGVDLIGSASSRSLRGLVARTVLRSPVAQTVRSILPYIPGRLSNPAVRYLLGYTLATSYQEGLKTKRTS